MAKIKNPTNGTTNVQKKKPFWEGSSWTLSCDLK